MRLCWLVAQLAVVALGIEVRAEEQPHQEASGAQVESDGPSTDVSSALELLPPGIRSPESYAAESLKHVPSDANGPLLVERIAADDGTALDVEYTIDPELDDRVRGVLESANTALGHVILLDPASGEVFSYVSTDPVGFPATGTYPTASLMKVVTAAAVLQKEPAATTRGCRYVGSPYSVYASGFEPPTRGGRVDSFERAIAISNNQCFARYAVDLVGEQGLLLEMQRTGLLEPPGIRHLAGRVDPIEDRLDLGYLGSGLAGSYISPLAAARLAAMLARGELVTPYWIARVRDAKGTSLAVPKRSEPRAVWSREVADQLREMMLGVTTDGTAKRGFHDRRGRPVLGGVAVSGKTGTLRGSDPAGLYQWFIGVAPAHDPQVAIATVVVSSKGRTSSATQLAALTLREVFCDAENCDASKSDWLAARVRTRRAIELEEAAVLAAAAAAEAAARGREAELAKMFEAHELDQAPQVIGDPNIDLPRRLLRYRARGKIVILLELDLDGEIMDARIGSSDLPLFNNFVLEQVRGWKFTPPMHEGRPVHARARLPIPIRVN